ncbi:alpha-N-acetylgalactosaminide alpha-2,6-sialyltransferase 1 [Trichechus manatus latirostris]|uniref:alpha-N-acetylgalactosaminide alpha-2,6-sialyltransferase n=1 Tax=Trichechus manatus latirostris TaxID=127582 RepID=A0A2Y9QUE7_TRIMA|nr:alpha-N-acetylgalactosaminide alpha-2,6-sialyltransferase 1 [Trichechus manatus latirostris]
MRSCPWRRCRPGRAVHWPLLLLAVLILLFSLPFFIEEPNTKPSRYQGTENIKQRSLELPQKANSQAPTVGRRTTACVKSARENSMLGKQLESRAHAAEESRTAEPREDPAVKASPGEQVRAPPTAKMGSQKSQEKQQTVAEILSPGCQDKRTATGRTGTPSLQSQDMKIAREVGSQHKQPTTPRTVPMKDKGTATAKRLTLGGQGMTPTTSAGVRGGRLSTRNRKTGVTPAIIQKKSTSVSIRTQPKATPKVKLKSLPSEERAASQGPTAQRAQRLKATNFKSEPRWDFEENYSLEVAALQTSCPDSVKVKASQSQWLQHLFLPNLTLFLDSKRFTQSEWDRLEHFAPPFGFMELNYSLVQRVVSRFAPVPQQQLLLASLPPGEPQCIRCAVVGNGGILNNSQVGREIDSHDYVFRLSGAVIKGYEQDVGTRTSFYGFTAFSLVQSIFLLGRQGFQHVPLGKNVRYLHFLEGTRDYEWLEALLLNQTLMGNNFHWFRRRPQEAFGEALPLDRYLLPHPDLLRYMKNRFLRSKTLDTVHWRIYRPTTGALLLLTALQLCDQVSAYGFITKGHERFSDHYYDKTWKKLVFYANHDFKLEQVLWKRLHDEGIIWLYQRPELPK